VPSVLPPAASAFGSVPSVLPPAASAFGSVPSVLPPAASAFGSVNHADPSRRCSVRYCHDDADALEIWTTRAVKAGEEMFCDYEADYAPCQWYDELMLSRGNVPLNLLAAYLNGQHGAPLN